MDFERRAPTISACMNLHNWCIDKRVELEAYEMREELGMVQPADGGRNARWQRFPKFDRHGRPVEYLDEGPHAGRRRRDPADADTATSDPTEARREKVRELRLKAPARAPARRS